MIITNTVTGRPFVSFCRPPRSETQLNVNRGRPFGGYHGFSDHASTLPCTPDLSTVGSFLCSESCFRWGSSLRSGCEPNCPPVPAFSVDLHAQLSSNSRLPPGPDCSTSSALHHHHHCSLHSATATSNEPPAPVAGPSCDLCSAIVTVASWKHVAEDTPISVLDCLNLAHLESVQHLQPKCLEDRFLPLQTRKKGTGKAPSLQHNISDLQLLPLCINLRLHLLIQHITLTTKFL